MKSWVTRTQLLSSQTLPLTHATLPGETPDHPTVPALDDLPAKGLGPARFLETPRNLSLWGMTDKYCALTSARFEA
jgi:hypothetical protein